MNQFSKIARPIDILATLSIAAYLVLLMYLSGNFNNSFQFIDAHDEVKIHYDIVNEGFGRALEKEMEYRLSHRFLPVYSFIRVVKVYFFGENWTAYYIYNTLLGIIGCCSLYWVGRLMQMGVLASVSLAFFTYIGFESWFNQATIIFRIASAELPALAILGPGLIAMALSAKRKNVLNGFEVIFICSVILTTLTKESFIILTPALLFWKAWLYSKEQQLSIMTSVKKHIPQAAFIFIVVAVEIGIVTLFIGTSKMGYVGVSTGKEQLMSILTSTKSFINSEGTLSILFFTFCVAMAVYASENFTDKRIESLKTWANHFWPHLILATLIITPQLLVYAKSGIYERYKLPLLVGISFLLATFLDVVYRSPRKFFIPKMALAIVLLLIFYRNTMNTFANAQSYAQSAGITTSVLTNIPKGTDEKILLISDPVLEWEWSISLVKYLKYSQGCTNIVVAPISIGQNEDLAIASGEDYYQHLRETNEMEIGEYYEKTTDSAGYRFVAYNLAKIQEVYLQQQPWYNNPHDSIKWGKGALLIYK